MLPGSELKDEGPVLCHFSFPCAKISPCNEIFSHVQILRFGCGHENHHGCRPNPWRLWLPEGRKSREDDEGYKNRADL